MLQAFRGAAMAAVAALGVSALGSGSADAGVIYDNLSSEIYRAAQGYTVSGASSPTGFDADHSESFVAAGTGQLGDIMIAMWHASSGTAGFTLTLTDSANNVLESWTADGADPIDSDDVAVHGCRYWRHRRRAVIPVA
jgi:hypothetical protein